MIVSDIAIARYYKGKAPVARAECRVVAEECAIVNGSTKTIVFEATDGRAKHNWKRYYKGSDFIAKHFLVRNIDKTHKDSVWRHYTICNAMEPRFYNNLIKSLKDASDPAYENFDMRFLNKDDSSQIMLTIKNYRHPKGLSPKIHDEAQGEQRFEVMGPMGFGLRPKTKGVHVAFAAGTGVLCFVDLVA